MIPRRTLLASAAFAPFAVHAQSAWAPVRPLRFVVPFVAGGSTDVAARIIADHMSQGLGQPVIVENRGGSGGNIGGDIVAKAPPDGHTLLMGVTGLLTTNQHIYPSMSFDVARDLAPVSMAYTSDMVIVVNNRLPVRTLREFVELAKQRPGAMSFGSSGHGASTHTAAELFKLQAGIDVVHVPYRGSGGAMNDLIAGNIEMMLVQIAATIGAIQGTQIRALAVTGPQRHALLPEVETVTEAGWPGATATSWGCVMVPGVTPAPAIARLNQAVRAAIADPGVQQRLAGAGVDGAASSPEELAAFLVSEREKWGRVVREARIRVE
ncbi:Bug family tripartite tricarboxylate transporter substrate binding protein [Plastoroseomonas arctica]|uniref:Tripartite tricarboxylate transporter substrate binding protein n=1 Tax=Plastoroseomonas arctica TaxID=1509237 RepID=A0AAF1K032_9PROT|nr:tripartite tricarboxylate transporter substrate binding protein [Plastoroseomonas arctica]MBR0654519.1 tripartite tricarboxylate transporter substrate binding protein [Plastoroseomonas arctica]